MRVEDDGEGLVTGEIPANSLGLGIMRERSDEIGASLAIDGQPGQGTTVTLIWRGSANQPEVQDQS